MAIDLMTGLVLIVFFYGAGRREGIPKMEKDAR